MVAIITALPTMFLQMFAEAGTLVNTTTQYVNAYTGEGTPFFGKNTMEGELKTFYDTELLENARIDLYYAQFAKKQPLPSGRGKVVEWRKWNTFERATRLIEGVIPTGQMFGMSYKTAGIAQYGTYATISDQLELHAYDDVILGATEEMGASAAETQEVLIRDALYTNTNVMYSDVIAADGTYVKTPTQSAGLVHDSTNGYTYITPKMINKVVTKMKKDKVPKINGKYVCVLHPSVAEDLRNSDEWIKYHQFSATTEIWNGEIGELHGVRFIEDTFAPIIKGENLAGTVRSLTINNGGGYSGAITSVTFDGGTVVADELIGRVIEINGISAVVTDNTATTITFDSTDFGTIADNDPINPGEGATGGDAAYACYFFGKDAFGIIDPEGGALQMIVHDKSEIGGALDQFSTIGYKFETNGATVLYPERVMRLMVSSSYSDLDDAN